MGNYWISPLRLAIRNRDTKAVKEILDKAGEGAPDLINEDYTADCFCTFCERNYQSTLHAACACYDFKDQAAQRIVELLVENGADVNAPGLWGQTPMHSAARQDTLRLFKYLFEHGGDLYNNETDEYSFYPVHCAALSPIARGTQRADVLKYIIEEIGKPDDIQLKDAKGNSPLHVACLWDNPFTAQYLIDKGADIHAKNNAGLTPRQVAKPTVVPILEKALAHN